MKEKLIMNSEHSLQAGLRRIQELYREHRYVTFDYRIGKDRSLDQNALLHVWLTEYAAHLLQVDKRLVTSAQLASIKRKMKKMFYLEHGYPWMIQRLDDLFGEEKSRNDFTSSKDWRTGEMYEFLTWLQMFAAEGGMILESKGQFNKLQRDQAA